MLRDELRPFFYAGFGLLNYYIYRFVTSLNEQSGSCPEGWKTGNLRLISQVAMAMAVVNLLIRFNPTVYGFPFIGGAFGLITLALVAMETYSLYWLCSELKQWPKCETGRYRPLMALMGQCSSLALGAGVLLIAAGLLYF